MQKLFIALLTVALTACGGGGSAEVEKEPAKQNCKPVRIQLFGDSTQLEYPKIFLQQAMNERFGFGAVVVSTNAVSGTDTNALVAGTDGLNKPWPQSVDSEIVVMNFGINDVLHAIDVETYKNNLRILAKAPAIVIFETPLPHRQAATSYDDAMREVAAEFKLTLIDSRKYVQSLPDWWQYAIDGAHPNEQGYSLIARNAKFPVLEPIVKNLLCK